LSFPTSPNWPGVPPSFSCSYSCRRLIFAFTDNGNRFGFLHSACLIHIPPSNLTPFDIFPCSHPALDFSPPAVCLLQIYSCFSFYARALINWWGVPTWPVQVLFLFFIRPAMSKAAALTVDLLEGKPPFFSGGSPLLVRFFASPLVLIFFLSIIPVRPPHMSRDNDTNLFQQNILVLPPLYTTSPPPANWERSSFSPFPCAPVFLPSFLAM